MALKAAFITFEGGEGSGKSTQIKLLKSWLEEKGKSVTLTREPGGTPGAETLRNLIVQGEDSRWSARTEALLLMAARCDNIEKAILPAIQDGSWVLCDRFVDSSYAYQSYGRGLNLDDIRAVYRFIAGDLLPDLTILFDIDPRLSLYRAMQGRGRNLEENRFEKLDFSFHEKLRNGYLEMAAREPDRFVVLALREEQTPEEVQELVRRIVQDRFAL